MAQDTILFTDDFCDVLHRPTVDVLEIRWFDTTSALTGAGFNAFHDRVGTYVEKLHPSFILVDAVQFQMDFAQMDNEWREANVIPRYNRCGVRKFAFLMPQGMPNIGQAPTQQGAADFPTGYFGRRTDALDWFADTSGG